MEPSKLQEVFSNFNEYSTKFDAVLLSIKNEMRGTAEFTMSTFDNGIPVNKTFSRNPKQWYRFMPNDNILLMSCKSADSDETIYYACEVIKGEPTYHWWYFGTMNLFKDCEKLLYITHEIKDS